MRHDGPGSFSSPCSAGVVQLLIEPNTMSTKERYRKLAVLSRRLRERAWDRELAAQLERIAADYERRADQEPDADADR
jgi:hypothetical protein